MKSDRSKTTARSQAQRPDVSALMRDARRLDPSQVDAIYGMILELLEPPAKEAARIKDEPAAQPEEVRDFLLEAARRVIVPNSKEDDRLMLEAARRARHEAGSFAELFNTVTTINGTVEVLYQMIRPRGDVPDDVNWTVVCDLLDDARRRLANVYSATSELWQYERDSKAGTQASAAAGQR